MTYDVEMAADGPLNYIANGIVSHNSHAACYALIAYRTAWLKANYPAEYMAALISSVMDTKDKVPFFVNQAESMGIEILPPDVNESDHQFVVVEGNIRFGLDAVKGVGFAAVEAIKAARERRRPVHVAVGLLRARRLPHGEQEVDRGADQVRRLRVDRREPPRHAGRAGVRAGARGRRPSRTRRSARARSSTSADSAATPAASPFVAPAHPPIPPEEFDRPQLLAMEKESIGLFITEHPLKRVREALRVKGDTHVRRGRRARATASGSRSAGCSPRAKKIKTRSGTTVMFATLDDLDGQVELLVFEKVILAARGALQPDADRHGPRHAWTRARAARSASRWPTSSAFDPSERGDRARPRAGRPARRRPRARGRCACAWTPVACLPP